MPTDVFVNLPTVDLPRSKAFYEALGATIVPEFTDENAACVRWDENVFFMILTKEFFASFTSRPVVLGSEGAQVIIALSRASRAEVDAVRATILEAGGGENKEPQDHGFMYGISMTDPDGNIIEFMWMDPVAAVKGPDALAAGQDG